MALIFDRQYYLDFDTTTGQDIKWTLEIWRSYDDADPTPPWVGTETKLVGTSNPIEITWERDYDVYKPIIGSSASINLLIQTAGQYVDFNAAGPYEYQVRLKYPGVTQQYTSVFTSPNTSFTPALVLPTGSQGRQLSLTETDGTVHRFAYLTNGLVRLLAGGLTGTVRLGPVAVATTATVTAAVTVPDQTADQTITLVGDETGTFAVGDFISPQANNFGAYRGIFIDSIIFDGTNTVIVGPSNGSTTFNTTSVLRNAGPATEIQGEGDTEDYWTGYMTALDGTESVGTFPFPISFTATDGLGLLEQATAAPQASIDPIRPWEAITAALIQTGLHFPIYLDSSIEVGDDSTPQVFTEALDTVTVSPEWIYSDRDRTEVSTYKEQLEKVLSSFNATIKQSNGKWYITNASTYGGTGDNETNTFTVYDAVTNVYVKGSDVTENLRYNINGTNTQDLVPSNEDLVLNTRRPYGSIECSPEGLFSRDIENGGFEIVNEDATFSPVGFSPGPTEGPLRTSTNIRQSGERSLFTPHNTFEIDTTNDVWFRNTNGIVTDSTAPIEVSFDYLTYERVEDTLLSIGFAYQISFVPDNEYKVSIPYFDLTLQNYVIGEVTAQELFYNADDSEWYVVSTETPAANFGFFTEKTEFPIDSGVWLEESQTLSRPAIYDSIKKEIVPPGPGKLYIRAFFPRAATLSGSIVNNGDAVMDFFIDNLSIRNMFANDITDPTFEAVQDNYTSTFTYNPGLASSTNDRLVQTLFEKDYRRTNTTAQDIETLEQIGTQLKLNDFRSQFRYYEGSLVNLTGAPLSPHHKVLVDWGVDVYQETASCIINGGRFNVKANQFEVAMYVPVQETDVVNEYYLENVDLIPMPFPGLSDKRTYTLNVEATTVDDMGVTVPNGLVPVMPSYQWTGSPGDKRQVEIALQPIMDMGAASATTIDPAPEYLSDIMYTINGSNLRVNALLTIPEETTLETLNISGVIRDFTPEANADVVSHTILFYRPDDSNVLNPTGDAVTETSPITGLATNYIRTSVGAAGIHLSQQQIIYAIEAVEGRVMTNVQETHTGGSLGIGVVSGNEERTAMISFDFTVPGTPSTISVFLDNTTTNDASGAVAIITKTLTITNNVANTTIEDGSTSGDTTTIEFKGTEGDFRRQNITVKPTNTRYIQSLTTTPGPTAGTPPVPVDGLIIGTPTPSGEDWEIPVEVSIVDNTVQPSFTIDGTVPVEPYSITFNVNNLGLNNAEIPMNSVQHRITFDEGDFGMDFPRATDEPLLVTVQPTGNNVFTASVAPYDIEIDINEAAATVTTVVDGMTNTVTRALPEIQFSPGTIVLQPDGSYVFPIGGTFPTREDGGGQYVLDVNIINSATSNGGSGGGPTEAEATHNTTLVPLTPGYPVSTEYPRGACGIGAGGGTAQFRLIADGSWEISNIEILLGGQGTMTSSDGTFEETYNSSTANPAIQPPLEFTQRGSIGPLSGGAGEHIITLTVDSIGYASRVIEGSPSIAQSFIAANWEIKYYFTLQGVGPANPASPFGAFIIGRTVQNGSFGSANIVFPGFADSTLMNRSLESGAENLLFFG